MRTRRLLLARLAVAGFAALLTPGLAGAQQPRASRTPAGPSLSASRSVMAGSMLSVFLSRMPAGARLAIARPNDPAASAIVVVEPTTSVPSLQTPGETGNYELRLTVQKDGGVPEILLRQPLATTSPSATLAAPVRVGRAQGLPVRGIGPNGEQDRVVLVAPDAPADATGPSFYPSENVEATLEAPDQPGVYELRYVMDAPLAAHRILARRQITVE